MMGKIRVLVADASAFVRHVLKERLSLDREIEVVGMAADGGECLIKLGQLNPDAICLDLELPELDGFQVTKIIRKSNNKLPIIAVSRQPHRERALEFGTSDFVQKAADGGDGLTLIELKLIPILKGLCSHRLRSLTPQVSAKPTNKQDVPARPAVSQPSTIKIVVIGVSTGGPNALAELLPHLVKPFPVPIVIVQHLASSFTGILADRLSTVSGFPVLEGKSDDILIPGTAWVAPGGQHLEIISKGGFVRMMTTEGPPENSCRPAADVTFRSAAKAYGAHVLGVVLTGMGMDGLQGSRAIKENNGRILVQDKDSSVVWGMPGAVYQAGLADKMVPLKEMAAEINRCVMSKPA